MPQTIPQVAIFKGGMVTIPKWLLYYGFFPHNYGLHAAKKSESISNYFLYFIFTGMTNRWGKHRSFMF